MSYAERLHQRISQLGTPALVGLDPRWDMLPQQIKKEATDAGGSHSEIKARAFEVFCRRIIEIVSPLVPAVKPQIAFFEQLGPPGIAAVQQVIAAARQAGLIVIADAKRGDIGSTAAAYADAWLAGEDPEAAPFAADSLTVNPYLGADTLLPFVQTAKDRAAGLYVLVRTSNPGAAVFQDRKQDDKTLFETVAASVESLCQEHWPDSSYGDVGAVVGATWPEELRSLRQQMPHVPLLVPGYGSQGGTAADVAGAFDPAGLGGLINSSRGINFAWRTDRFSTEFTENEWEAAVEAATHFMIEDLRTGMLH